MGRPEVYEATPTSMPLLAGRGGTGGGTDFFLMGMAAVEVVVVLLGVEGAGEHLQAAEEYLGRTGMPRGLSRPKRGGRRSLEAIITTHAPRTEHQDDTHTLHRSRPLALRYNTPRCAALVIRVNDDGIYALSLHYGIEYTNQPLLLGGGCFSA